MRGEALTALGTLDEAESALLEAHRGADLISGRWLAWRIDAALGRLCVRQRRTADADQAFARARQTIDDLASALPAGRLQETFVAQAARQVPAPRTVSENVLAKARFGGLTLREREVAALLASGLSNRAVADRLVIGERTVESYVSSILNKLGYTSSAQIAAWAVDRGLARPG